ncbi:hypothetical protein [uncultured Albimonas sp.]|uniref:hypothetical protein n=1 Tax=uncultured Albimonas sp. TaxID=1331701 RepID=UPI0030EB919D|tara:strand:- start:3909 stop:4127 length:219 start_codon:yes stop_codon:yes gene_type:complete
MTPAERASLIETAGALVATAEEARALAATLPPASKAWCSVCAIAAEAPSEAQETLALAGLPPVFAVEQEGRA